MVSGVLQTSFASNDEEVKGSHHIACFQQAIVNKDTKESKFSSPPDWGQRQKVQKSVTIGASDKDV
jgi:hypothetical protein